MLYPTNLKIKSISRIKLFKEKVLDLINGVKTTLRYLIFNTPRLFKIIAIKLHI